MPSELCLDELHDDPVSTRRDGPTRPLQTAIPRSPRKLQLAWYPLLSQQELSLDPANVDEPLETVALHKRQEQHLPPIMAR